MQPLIHTLFIISTLLNYYIYLTLLIFKVWPTEMEISHVFSWSWEWWYERREFFNYFLTTTVSRRFEFWHLLLHHWQFQLLFKTRAVCGPARGPHLARGPAVFGGPQSARGCFRCVKSLKVHYFQLDSHCWTLVNCIMTKIFKIFKYLEVALRTFMFIL